MAVEFDDAQHFGIFTTSAALNSQTGKMVRQSSLVLAALRAAGAFDNMVDGTVEPAHDKLWLDKNFDPPKFKEWDSVGSSWQEMTFDRLFGRAIVTQLTVTGGTANAITVGVPLAFLDRRLYALTPTANNSGPVTIQVPGVGIFGLKYHDGSNVAANELIAGQNALLIFTSGRFEVLYPFGPVYAAQIAAEAAKVIALQARDEALAAAAGVNLPPVAPDRMLVDNAAGTARESQTFAQVRQHLQAIAVSELGALEAWNRGVPGDGTDQTTALQALVNSLPAEGGQIIIKGDVVVSSLNLQGKRNTKFLGLGGNGTGASQRSRIRTLVGAIGANNRVIDARDSFNISFENLFLHASDAAFDGRFIDFTNISSGSALMSLDDCYVNVAGSTAKGLFLYGATQGSFERTTFGGAGYLVQMQNAVGVGWCNIHNFRSCNFKPTGTHVPILGSGEGITFQSCNIQASSADGVGRFWQTDLTQPFKAVSVVGCTFYDVLTTGGIWGSFYTGRGLKLSGNFVGGAQNVAGGANFGFQIGGGTDGVSGAPLGVAGFEITSNVFEYMSAGIAFGGTLATFDYARAGFAAGNVAYGTLSTGKTALFSNVANTERFIVLPNEINAGPNDFGSHFNVRYAGLPTSSAGLQTGDVWNNAGVMTIV